MKNLLIIVFGIISLSAFSQNCNDFLANAKIGIKYPWKFDNQSKTGLFVPGKTSVINIVCQEGKDYKVTFSISSSILKGTTIAITDAEGNEYYTYGGVNKASKELAKKRELMVSFEKQKLTIKGSKAMLQLDKDMKNLQLEISKMEAEQSGGFGAPKMFFEFTPASAMNLTVTITLGKSEFPKGCIAMLITNKPAEQGF